MSNTLLMIMVQLVDISAYVLAPDLVPAVHLAIGLIIAPCQILGKTRK